jgi:Flp pilus assembly protein TadD
MLRVTLEHVGDSLDVRASFADSASHTMRDALARRFAASELAEIESQVAAAVAGRLHRVNAPFEPHNLPRAVDPESYRLTILGFHQLLALRDAQGALASFTRASELDPLNARAWAGMSSVWSSLTTSDQLPLEEGIERVTTTAERALAIDSTDGTALANIGIIRAIERRDLSVGMSVIRRALASEPSNAEIYLVASFLDRYAHRWDEARDLIRVARELDPLTPRYAENEGGLEMCADRPAAAEQVFRRVLDERPASAASHEGLVRALALQGRFDEALDAWRLGITPKSPASVVAALRVARGRDGYFAVWHADGREQLAALLRSSAGKRVSPLQLMFRKFQAGDSAAGFAGLAAGVRDRAAWIYRLPCFPSLDGVRGTPHFRAMLAEIGAMPAL